MKSGAGVPLTGSLRTFVCGTGRVYIPQDFFVASDRGFDSASGGYFLSASGSTDFCFLSIFRTTLAASAGVAHFSWTMEVLLCCTSSIAF